MQSLPDKNLPLELRYKLAGVAYLENLRNKEGVPLTSILSDYGCLPTESSTEDEITSYQEFYATLYPALDRLRDLRYKALEALHKITLESEKTDTIKDLLKILNHDILEIEGANKPRNLTQNFIKIDTAEFNNILENYGTRRAIKETSSPENI